jgi:DNA ligase 1
MRWKAIVWTASLLIMAALATPLRAGEVLPLLLAEVDDGRVDVTLYLVSEKFDGVRAYWDGAVLRTRKGNTINAPAWFTENFPKRELDGELWMARGKFDSLSATVRRQAPVDAEWLEVRYLLFELPQAPGSFRERVAALRTIAEQTGVPWLQAVEQFEVSNRKALARKLAEVLKAGGEGLMLHRADAPYVTGRSDVLLKLKAWRDAEATVTAHEPGKGKYKGLLGALRVQTEDGRVLRLGTGLSDADRRNPPAIGTVVTFRYRELTSQGTPRFASYYRVRE